MEWLNLNCGDLKFSLKMQPHATGVQSELKVQGPGINLVQPAIDFGIDEIQMAKIALDKCLKLANYHWQQGDASNGHFGFFLESVEGVKRAEFIYYLDPQLATRLVVDFDETMMRDFAAYLKQVLK